MDGSLELRLSLVAIGARLAVEVDVDQSPADEPLKLGNQAIYSRHARNSEHSDFPLGDEKGEFHFAKSRYGRYQVLSGRRDFLGVDDVRLPSCTRSGVLSRLIPSRIRNPDRPRRLSVSSPPSDLNDCEGNQHEHPESNPIHYPSPPK
ncbi:MAG: hypothetical protein KGI72_05470 [Patescibacteria group bacterium]|nr:hypothetical protein [Patescibacteria group bacterium]